MNGFGDPHLHAGLGLRKIGPEYFECRIDLGWRMILWQRQDDLLAYEIMSHDEVRAWLRAK
jgi:hypothetical protein